MEDDDDFDNDFLCNESLSDTSICLSEPDDSPKSISLDLTNGTIFDKNCFTICHYNIVTTQPNFQPNFNSIQSNPTSTQVGVTW